MYDALRCTAQVMHDIKNKLHYITLVYNAVYSDSLLNAVCLYNAFFAIDFCKCSLFQCFVIDTVCLFQILFCIMHSAFNLLVFPILCSHIFFIKGLCALGEIALKNNHYYKYLSLHLIPTSNTIVLLKTRNLMQTPPEADNNDRYRKVRTRILRKENTVSRRTTLKLEHL